MKSRSKILLVVAGYAGAFLAASAALALRIATEPPDAQSSAGMYAFGDLSLFVAVFFLAALVPTTLALIFLRARPLLWSLLSSFAIVLALSGVAAIVVYVTGRNADPRSALADWAGLAPLRMLAAPLLAVAFFVFAVVAPRRSPRILLAIAAICEAAVTAGMGVLWFHAFQP